MPGLRVACVCVGLTTTRLQMLHVEEADLRKEAQYQNQTMAQNSQQFLAWPRNLATSLAIQPHSES